MEDFANCVSIIDKCVKCECKFTTPDKPLKLLPCLHSMCLDCLYGRIPLKKPSPPVLAPKPNTSSSAEALKTNTSSAALDTSESRENGDTENASSQDNISNASKTPDDSTSKDAEAKEDSTGEAIADDPNKAENNAENGEPEVESKNCSERRVSSENGISKPDQTTPQLETNGDGKTKEQETVAEEPEPEDVKPTPATGKQSVKLKLT